jgi:hypothetical protein
MIKKRTKAGDPDRKEIAEKVFEGMRSGLSAFKACQKAKISQTTFNGWLNDDESLAVEYARAREELLEYMANEIIEIADEPVGSTDSGATDSGAVQKQRLQVDTRKWLLSKLAPKKWGDRVAIAGDDETPLKVESVIDVSKLPTEVLAQIVSAKDATNKG